jgi:hypothetical protein
MRVQFSDLVRPKQAAKHLVRLCPDLTLAAVHEALSRALGYRDWHEFSVTVASQSMLRTSVSIEDAARVVGAIADDLGVPDPDVQFAAAKARLFGEELASLGGQLGLRARLWRIRLFGPPARGKPGTIVRDKARRNQPAYLVKGGRPTRIFQNIGFGHRADFEVSTPKTPLADFVPVRLWLPYGYWQLGDGSEVLFARDYLPLWRIHAGSVERVDPWLWINGKQRTVHFSTIANTVEWAGGAARSLAQHYLAQHRIIELPKLVDVMPALFDPEVETIGAGVAQMRADAGSMITLPAYATENTRLAWS